MYVSRYLYTFVYVIQRKTSNVHESYDWNSFVFVVFVREGKQAIQWRLLQEVVHPAGQNGPSYRPVTRYEMKAAAANRTVWDFEFSLSKC